MYMCYKTKHNFHFQNDLTVHKNLGKNSIYLSKRNINTSPLKHHAGMTQRTELFSEISEKLAYQTLKYKIHII